VDVLDLQDPLATGLVLCSPRVCHIPQKARYGNITNWMAFLCPDNSIKALKAELPRPKLFVIIYQIKHTTDLPKFPGLPVLDLKAQTA